MKMRFAELCSWIVISFDNYKLPVRFLKYDHTFYEETISWKFFLNPISFTLLHQVVSR